jgi:hypothetical protein
VELSLVESLELDRELGLDVELDLEPSSELPHFERC